MQQKIVDKLKNIETPFYFYERAILEKNAKDLLDYFKGCQAEIFFAAKANTALYVLDIIRKQKLGAEVVSPGEVFVCLQAGFTPGKILYNNIARKVSDIIYAMKKGVLFYNFEALDQLFILEQCAKRLHKKIFLFARINPGIFPDTHTHLSTGAPSSKFGMEAKQLGLVVKAIRRLKYAKFVGLHSHIGSQVLSPMPFIKGANKASDFIRFFEDHDIKIDYVNLGGGFGVTHKPDEKPLIFEPIIKSYKNFAEKHGVKIFLEPGRFIVSNAGYIVSEVISIKQRKGIPLYILDAGMTENPRPALYDAYHHIEPLLRTARRKMKVRVAGPLCENTDEFGIYYLPKLKIGDRVLIHNCGAYTRTMASNYNGRLLPPEYVIGKSALKMIRKKQQFPSLIQNETY
ncbi:MAG: diaminopimelate decarboxylase [bacterium]